MSPLVTNRKKKSHPKLLWGRLDTYWDYPKIMVSNSCSEPLARNHSDKVLVELGHLAPPDINFSVKVMKQKVFNGDHAW